jgi:hypothetical protein
VDGGDEACTAAGGFHEDYRESTHFLENCENHQMHHLRNIAEATYTNVDTVLKATACTPSSGTYKARRGQGSNGADDNCDFISDDCSEDQSAPIVWVDPSVNGKRFNSIEAATTGVAASILAWVRFFFFFFFYCFFLHCL